MSVPPRIIFSISQNFSKAFNKRLNEGLLQATLILSMIFLNLPSARAESDLATIPPEFGQVIYRCQERSPNQLFIIGMSHRDSLTGLSIPGVSRVQAEIYKLGEWLVQNERCELILPEGFFAGPSAKPRKEQARETGGKLPLPESLDFKTLEEKLSDNRSFVNAEILLKRNYSLKLKQVEDLDMHRAVGVLIRKLVNSGNDDSEYLRVKSDLDYLQERRTAAMLQNIPGIIQAEFREGNISARKALFTIGLSHLPRIIRYLEESKVRIYSPPLGAEGNKDYTADLNLIKEKFGVSVLLPQTLARDRETLKIIGLDGITLQPGRHSSARSFPYQGN